MKSPLVSIVMLCWNRRDDVRESLSRIRESTYPNIEIIVVDNHSTDGTPEMIETEFPEVRLLRMSANIGIAAYNVGFEQARGQYIVILDDDSFPEKHAIERMVRRFESDPKLGVVAFDVRNYYSGDDIKIVDEIVDKADTAANERYYMSFNGAGAGIRADVFREAGYYPAEFFLYNNELDTAYRIWDIGYAIRSFPDIVGYHKFSPVNRSSWRAPFYYTRNAFWVAWKNYPAGQALRVTMELIYRCFYHSLEQRTWIYLKAMASAFVRIGEIKGKRKPVIPDIARRLRAPVNINFTYYR